MPALPLAELYDLLRAEGFAIGIDDHIRIGRLLEYDAAWTPELLRTAIAALVMTTPEDRDAFDACWERWLSGGRRAGRVNLPGLRAVPPRTVRRMRISGAALVAAVVAIVVAVLVVRYDSIGERGKQALQAASGSAGSGSEAPNKASASGSGWMLQHRDGHVVALQTIPRAIVTKSRLADGTLNVVELDDALDPATFELQGDSSQRTLRPRTTDRWKKIVASEDRSSAYVVDRWGNKLYYQPLDKFFMLGRSSAPLPMTRSGGGMLFTYDGYGRIHEVDLGSGGRVTYEYDASGRLASIVDARGRRKEYQYSSGSAPVAFVSKHTLAIRVSLACLAIILLAISIRKLWNKRLPIALHTSQPAQQPKTSTDQTGLLKIKESNVSGDRLKLGGENRYELIANAPGDKITVRPRWFTHIVPGILAISVAAGVTYLIIRSTREGAPTTGSVHLESVPAGADVRFDGTLLSDRTPLTIDGAPVGTHHTIRMELAGYETGEEVIVIPKDGHEISVTKSLKALTGSILVNSEPPGAEIWINGELRGRTPTTITNVDMSSAKVLELRLRDYQPYRQDLVWKDGRIDIEATLQR